MAFDVFERRVADDDDFAAVAEEGGEFVEDGLVDDVGLEEDEGFVTFGGG